MNTKVVTVYGEAKNANTVTDHDRAAGDLQPLEVGQRWYVTFGKSGNVFDVMVAEITAKTVALRDNQETALASFGIDYGQSTDRYAIWGVTFLELLSNITPANQPD